MLIPKAFLISLVGHYKYTYWKFWPPNKTANPYNWRKFPSTTHFKDVTAACINKTLASDILFISPKPFFFSFLFLCTVKIQLQWGMNLSCGNEYRYSHSAQLLLISVKVFTKWEKPKLFTVKFFSWYFGSQDKILHLSKRHAG